MFRVTNASCPGVEGIIDAKARLLQFRDADVDCVIIVEKEYH